MSNLALTLSSKTLSPFFKYTLNSTLNTTMIKSLFQKALVLLCFFAMIAAILTNIENRNLRKQLDYTTQVMNAAIELSAATRQERDAVTLKLATAEDSLLAVNSKLAIALVPESTLAAAAKNHVLVPVKDMTIEIYAQGTGIFEQTAKYVKSYF